MKASIVPVINILPRCASNAISHSVMSEMYNGTPASRFLNGLDRCLREAAWIKRHPNEDVRVQENHLSASQSSRGVTGETMSPTIFAFPAI